MSYAKLELVSPQLQVSNLDRSIDFYRRALGLEVSWCVGEPPNLASVCRDNVEIVLELAPTPVPSHIYITVEGVDGCFAKLLAEGARELVPLADRWYGMRDGRVADPDGNQIGVGEAKEGKGQT